jgi:hypothetical protein
LVTPLIYIGAPLIAEGSPSSRYNEKPAAKNGGFEAKMKFERAPRRHGSFLPRALLVAIRLQALPALVLVHLQTALLFQVAHGGGESWQKCDPHPVL